MKILFSALLMLSAGLSLGQSFTYDEAIDGDLSDDYTNPTDFVVSAGDNFLIGALAGGGSKWRRRRKLSDYAAG